MKAWESWCRQQRRRVRAVEADVPQGIMPAGIKASLTDIKVVLVTTMQNMGKSIIFFKKKPGGW